MSHSHATTVSAQVLSTRWAVGIAGFSSIVVALVWLILPMGRFAGSGLLGTSVWAPDNLLNLSILEWGRKSLLGGHWNVFQWPPGFPVPNSLAGTENLLGWQWLYMPFRALGFTMVGAFNGSVIASFGVSGASAALLARSFGVSGRGAVVAGVTFALSSVRLAQLAEFQTLSACWLPLDLFLLHRYLGTGRNSYLVGLASTVVITTLSSIYYGIYFVLIGAIWIMLQSIRARRMLAFSSQRGLAIAALVVVTCMSPMAWVYVSFAHREGFRYPLTTYIDHSSSLIGFLHFPPWLALWQSSTFARSDGTFPGFMLIVAVLVAMLHRRRNNALPGMTLMILAFICIVFALGPVLKIHDYPARGGRIWLPGKTLTLIPGLREPSRWLACALVFLAPLVGWGVECLTAGLGTRWRTGLATILTLAVIVENWPSQRISTGSVRPPPPLSVSSAYRWLLDCHPRGASVELPTSDLKGFRVGVMSEYVYGAVTHGQPVVSYYAAHWLPELDSLQAAAEQLPSSDARAILEKRGVMRVILHGPLMSRSDYMSRSQRLRDAGYHVDFEGSDAIVFGWSTPVDSSASHGECTAHP